MAMKAKAITRHIRQSPRKIRVVLNEVRGREVEDALNFLHFSKAKAATQIEKTVRSAVANLMNIDSESEVNTAELYIKECYADGGPHMKRFRAASMGRISKLNKPTSHLTIVVSDEKN
jgi:large subunit ribosomal protein L22